LAPACAASAASSSKTSRPAWRRNTSSRSASTSSSSRAITSRKGQQLTEGPIDPHEILDICGPQELQEHLVNEVQEVYRLQGVTINDKHVEIIVRQMLRKVRITEPGDTGFLWGEQVDKLDFEDENARVEKMGGKPAEAQPVLAWHH
jgi:hypothetical protein